MNGIDDEDEVPSLDELGNEDPEIEDMDEEQDDDEDPDFDPDFDEN